MSDQRIFHSAHCFEPSDDEPIRSVVATTTDATIVAWHVKAGQTIKPHRHPAGQDTWIVLTGQGDYVINETGQTMPIQAGDIVIARTGDVHGLHNTGQDVCTFISVVAPAQAGYELLHED
jgi:quercetin dioxygenase-like cupin family protein